MERGIIIIAGPQGSGKSHLTQTIITDESKMCIGLSNEIDLRNTINLIDNISRTELSKNLIVECGQDILKEAVCSISKLHFKRIIIKVQSNKIDMKFEVDSPKVLVSVINC